jgi:hypothetical protein
MFEIMPVELHFKVLTYLPSPRDVLSTIRASPAAFNAYRSGKERIYAFVLEQSLAGGANTREAKYTVPCLVGLIRGLCIELCLNRLGCA